jgi:uncharacterized protein (DUF58 family)
MPTLRGFRLSTRALSAGSGERVSRFAGGGGEFLDYRAYEPGDEPRFVDWNVYARSGKLFTRQFRSERSTRVYAVLDVSASMRDKLEGARRVRGFLKNFARLDTWLEREVDGLKDHLPRLALEKPGLVLLISDGLEPLSGVRAGLTALSARGFDVSFVQLLSRDDLEPPTGAWRIADAESGGRREVDDAARRLYLERLGRHLEGLAGLIRGAGLRHAQLRGADIADVFARLRRARILERG